MLLCLGYSVGRAQSCFITILCIPASLLHLLAPNLYPMPCFLHRRATPCPCICLYTCPSGAPCICVQTCTYTTDCVICTVSMRVVSVRACAKFHCELVQSFIASVLERICNFGASVPEGSTTLAHGRSAASSTLTLKLQVHSK